MCEQYMTCRLVAKQKMLDIEALKVTLLTLLGTNFLDRVWLSPGPVCRNVQRLCSSLPLLLGIAFVFLSFY